VRTSPPEPIEGLSQSLEDLLARALAKNPEDRPQTVLELASELDEALHARRGIPRGLLRALLVVAAISTCGTGVLVAKVLEKRRAGQGEGAASPSPVASAAVVVRTNPRLAAALGEVQQALDRRTSIPIEPLKQLKTTLFEAASETERELIRAAVGRVLERALEGDGARFESVAALDLPLPDDPALRSRLAQRWLARAAERAPREPIDVQGILQKLAGSDTSGAAIEAAFTSRIQTLEPTFAAYRRARALDSKSVPSFRPSSSPSSGESASART